MTHVDSEPLVRENQDCKVRPPAPYCSPAPARAPVTAPFCAGGLWYTLIYNTKPPLSTVDACVGRCRFISPFMGNGDGKPAEN